MAGRTPRWATRHVLNITQAELLALALRHEPEASASKPSYRMATCVKCLRPMIRMWHCWLTIGDFKKEVHLCYQCGLDYQ